MTDSRLAPGQPIRRERRMRSTAGLLFTVVLALSSSGVLPVVALAQVATATLQDSTAVRLQVVDSAQRAVTEAEVFVVQLNLTARTNANGVVLIRRSSHEAYDIRVRKAGFLPAFVRLAIGAEVASHVIVLRAIPTQLAPVVTEGRWQGLTVFVSDTALHPLARARVSVLGSGRSARTDTNGRAQMRLSAGSYLVHIERDSFAHTTIAVSVPNDSGREVAAWLRRRTADQRALEAVESRNLFDLDRRMLRASPSMSRYFTRAQLEAMGVQDMLQLARRWSSGAIGGECTVTIWEGGQPYGVPITAVYTNEVEFVELYLPSVALKTPPRGNTSLGGNRTRIMTAGSGVAAAIPACGNLGLMVWPRK